MYVGTHRVHDLYREVAAKVIVAGLQFICQITSGLGLGSEGLCKVRIREANQTLFNE